METRLDTAVTAADTVIEVSDSRVNGNRSTLYALLLNPRALSPTFSLPPNPAVRVRFHENAHQASVILAASTTAARSAPMEIIGTVTFLDSGNLATVLHDLGLALGDTSAEVRSGRPSSLGRATMQSSMPFSPFSTWAVEVLPSYDMARTRDDSATTARFVVAYTGPGRTDRTFVQFTLGAEDTKRLDGKLVGFIAQADFLGSLGMR